ncbi:hypothetical protein B0O99DRAFT_689441 [Bisporella sp. PMI_857]|nr:hypothetical protein B0O99DRAFT_689441 [Bisporella sp. PMI_857]
MLDEGRFWDMYSTARNDVNEAPVISLLVHQAMLFSTSTLVPLAILKACGFQNYYTAREIFHQRAKLLYNFRTETDFTAIAQASLLLSFQSTSDNTQANTSWLSTAIQYARADSAHLYCLRGLTSRQRRGKKQLWWCCVLRGRVVALGVRRHLQITLDHFDLHQEAVTERDFAEEVQLSQVYDSESKKLLVKVFMAQCQLAIAVTSTVMAIYPLSGVTIPAVSVTSQQLTIQNQIEKSKIELLTWLETAKPQLTPNREKFAAPHNSVILYADLTYIHYFSVRLALCHYSMYMLGGCHAFATDCTQRLKAIQGKLEDGIHNDKQALPLVLLSLDVRFSSTESRKSRCKHQLSVYMEVMKHYGHRFTFVGVDSDTIRKLLQLVNLNECPTCPTTKTNSLDTNLHRPNPPSVRPKSRVEFVTRQPQLYSKLSISLDFVLSKGKYPSEKERPGWALNLALPQATVMPIELARPASHISALNPRGSLTGHSRFLGDEFYNQQQKYQLSEATRLSPIASDVFGLENGMEVGLLCGVDHIDTANHHDDGNTNESAYNRLAGIFDVSLMGGCTNGCA